jgi:hypothetical protein
VFEVVSAAAEHVMTNTQTSIKALH